MLGLSKNEIHVINPNELEQRIQQVKYQMLNAGAHYVIDSIAELPLIIELIHKKGNSHVA